LNDLGDDATDLPVLQHVLNRTYGEFVKGGGTGEIQIEHYVDAGTMKDALNKHADAVFTGLSEAARPWTEKVFRCLTAEEGVRKVRNAVGLELLYVVVDAADEGEKKLVREVIDGYARNSLVVHTVNKRTGDRDIDISHESLILFLKKLKQWADEEAKSVGWYQRAVDDAVRGANAWRGADLKLALKHLESGAWNATWAGQLPNRGAEFARVKDYLERGQAEEAAKVEKAERDRAKELADAQALAEAERKAKVAAEALSAARKRANRLLLGVGAVAMIMLVLFLVG
jgi:hypothetical protein